MTNPFNEWFRRSRQRCREAKSEAGPARDPRMPTLDQVHQDVDAYRDRQSLLEQGMALAREAYVSTKEADSLDRDLVVLIVDVNDKEGAGLMEALSSPEMVEKCRREFKGFIPTMTIALPARETGELLSRISANSRHVLSTPPQPGYFSVVVIARGGNLFAQSV